MPSEHQIAAASTHAQARAQRLLWVRRMVNLPRHVFSDYPGLNPDCIYRWEKVKRGGLTRKGAQKVVERLAQLGVVCTAQWLLEGLGSEPFLQTAVAIDTAPLIGTAEERQIATELAVFRHNAHTVEWLVPDDTMTPEYRSGDYVAGIELAQLSQAIGLVCIVQTQSGERLLRKVEAGSQEGHYTLLCTQPATHQAVIEHNVALRSVAPVLWRRRTWSAVVG